MENFERFKRKVGIILLAAGPSTRLGQSKQLLDIGGEPLLKKSVETALGCLGNNIIVVLGAQHELHEQVISHLSVQVALNKDWKDGMGSSLKAGLKVVRNVVPDPEAFIIMVCDQPLVSKEHLDKLIQAHLLTGHKIVASSYNSVVGVPALFHQSLFDSIMKIDNQHGAKKIIEANPELVKTIEFPGGAIDIDTEEDYDHYRRISRKTI